MKHAVSLTSLTKLCKEKIMKPGLFAASLLAAAMTLATGLPLAQQAHATDLDVATTDNGDEGHFVRLGLNKSAVIRLPADARDVIVGNPAVVDAVVRTKNTAYLFAKTVGQTNIFFFDAQGNQILNLDLEVALDSKAIKKLLNRALPGNRITVDTVNNSIVLGGIASNPLEAKTAMDLASQFIGVASAATAASLTSGTPGSNGSSTASSSSPVINTMQVEGEDQVMMKVKVVEIQRDVTKQFGINFTALLDAGKFAFNLSSVAPFAQSIIGADNGYKGTYQNGNNKVEGLIRALEEDGLARTMAEPTLTALTGQAAKFHAGGEFKAGETCAASNGIVNCTVSFKEYGISLGFTPTVLSDRRINLKIDTDVSEIGSQVYGGVPTINTRSANTMLELPNGGTMMLAGLISETTRHNINGTPGLKNIPVLGSLFRSRDFINNETELVIFVTPYIVRPTTEASLDSPDKNLRPSSDAQAILFGRLNKVYGSGAKPSGEYKGNVGFIVQ